MYICIENEQVISTLDYEPNVPDTVTVVKILDSEFSKIKDRTHYFDVKSMSVIDLDTDMIRIVNSQEERSANLQFLQSTDWKVLRHIRQLALGVPTTLTNDEYLALESERNIAATKI